MTTINDSVCVLLKIVSISMFIEHGEKFKGAIMRHFMLTLTHTIVQGYNIGLVGSTENTNMILEAFYKV